MGQFFSDKKSLREARIASTILLLLVTCFYTPTAKASLHTPEYLIGLSAGLSNNPRSCDIFLKQVSAPGTIAGLVNETTPKYVHCQAGFNQGEHQRALTSPQYGIGYQLGKSDVILGLTDPDSACKDFGPDVNYGPYWFCTTGYSDANSQHFKIRTAEMGAIKAYHQTLPYRIGFRAGVANKIGICDQFRGRNATICFNALSDGFNSNLKKWEQTAGYKHGFKLGVADARLQITPDNAGACDTNSNFTSDKNLCVSGYDHGYSSVKGAGS